MLSKNLLTKVTVAVLFVALVIGGMFTGIQNQGQDLKVQASETNAPKYVFYFIGDGLGSAQRQLAEIYLQETTGDQSAKLRINSLPIAGINTTYSADTLVTDSAAAGTALATGFKTNNGMISQTPDGENVKTLIEAAEEKGMATGIVSTTRITHATPAVFASHNENRNNENEIAADFVDSGVEYFAGGGYRNFVPQDWEWGSSKRTDDRNLISEFEAQGYEYFLTEDQTEMFRNYEPSRNDKMVGLFTSSHLPYEIDRVKNNATPSIAELTKKGIDLLSQYDDGFFMMVEGGRIDHACHANDPQGSIHDTLAFDKAVEEAYDFYMNHPEETLIVVVGDHETGGMGLGFSQNYWLNIEPIEKAKVSVEDVLNYIYDGDREAYFEYISKNLGLNDLTAEERAEIVKAMDIVDNDEDYDGSIYGPDYYGLVGIATTHIVSERANLQWTTFAHSGTQIPMSALGVGSENFGGFKDNTEIAITMADLLGFELTK
ncbi:alkaline phosphatase [Sporosalibacterium faouarense]|uniref:alkaline phosphatase n=1 Tax=Sporosalibacterium faouarense TaxID=516123 RepID=UPI00141D5B1A|nr:alkaline phosphatase [Sporosalibacterium faouarense]MTI46714.1 alkaline phosphatase [Bacillota bacterium]